jgi:hypothetical protein
MLALCLWSLFSESVICEQEFRKNERIECLSWSTIVLRAVTVANARKLVVIIKDYPARAGGEKLPHFSSHNTIDPQTCYYPSTSRQDAEEGEDEPVLSKAENRLPI